MSFEELAKQLLPLAKELPDAVRSNAQDLIARMGEVIEGIGDEPVTWKPVNLRLVQGSTDRSNLPRGTAPGDFIMGEVKVEQPLKFIPIRMWKGRQMWSPDPNENKLLCSSPDAKVGYIGNTCSSCPHGQWEDGKGSECTATKNALAITHDLKEIFLVVFSKTNFKTGTELESAAKKAGVAPYRRVYGLGSTTNSQFKNVENFKLDLLSGDEKIVPEEYLSFLKALFNAVDADRKESVSAFHRLIEQRKASGLIEAPQVTALADQSLVVEGEPSSTSSMAKQFHV